MRFREAFFERLDAILRKTKTDRIIVAFSGGKDSTVLLSLALEYAIERSLSLAVLHVDTLVENPIIRDYCDRFLNSLSSWSKENHISVEVIRVEPEPEMTFWVNLIGKGYPMPNFRFRWCQNHLKIKPAKRVLRQEKGILLVATRKSESSERKRSLEKRMKDVELERNGVRAFAPLYDWTDEDVWEFLLTNSPPWGGDYSELISLYREARGECPLIPDKTFKGSGCGSRFGCWVCSVVREDKTMKNLALKDEKLRDLLTFREWLIDYCNRPENRSGRTRSGKFIGEGKGMLTLEARREILEVLLNLQEKVSMELIRRWEINIIKNIWKKDKEKYPQLASV